MPSGPGERYDFFLSRRGSVAAIAREVTDVLTEKGYKVRVQDYDFQLGASFVEEMHEAIKKARDLVILFTRDYEQSPYTRKEFTSFAAQAMASAEERHVIILRCEDLPLEGLLADNVYQDLVGVVDPEERKRRIIAAAERQSQAAPPPPRPFMGMPPRIASFTGRSDELDRLDAILMQDKPAAVTQASVGRAAVQGMGGVGKTSLAIEYAHRYRSLYAGVCWCSAETRTGLRSALAGLAVTLGAARADEADIERSAKAALERLPEQRATWLLVYDNVTSPDEIADLLPSAGARVLITSRFSDWGELADEVALNGLTPQEAIEFLQARTGRKDPSSAEALAKTLGYLPLALDHAAAFCKRTQMRFAEYEAKASTLITIVPRGVNYPESVSATFDLAISQAVSQCASAEALMAFLAQCAPDRIPMLLVEGAIDEESERLRALAALSEISLVKHNPFDDDTKAVTVHRLVQAAARTRSEKAGSAQAAVRCLIERLIAIYPEKGDPSSLVLSRQLSPHLLALRVRSDADLPRWGELLRRAGGYASNAAPFFRNVLEFVLGPEHPLTAAGLEYLGRRVQTEQDFGKALSFFERVLTIREKMLGPGHELTNRTRHDMSGLLLLVGHPTEALTLGEAALTAHDKALGRDHPWTKDSALVTADALDALGRPEEAKALRERYGVTGQGK